MYVHIYVCAIVWICTPLLILFQNIMYTNTFSPQGSNLNNVREADYSITVGGEPCPVFRITENSVACTPPQTRPGGRTSVPVIVSTSVCVCVCVCVVCACVCVCVRAISILCKIIFNHYPDTI